MARSPRRSTISGSTRVRWICCGGRRGRGSARRRCRVNGEIGRRGRRCRRCGSLTFTCRRSARRNNPWMADSGMAGRLAGLVALSSGDARLDALIRLTCGRALTLRPLPAEVDLIDGTSEDEAVVAAFAEQFAVDVTGIGEHQRKQFVKTLGDKVFR